MPYNALMHEEEIADWFAKAMSKKYRAGQDEHGGKLWRKPMLKNMQDEVVDLVVYFHTHNMQQLKLTSMSLCRRGMMHGTWLRMPSL